MSNTLMSDVIIIGGGASGMMAAIIAARNGKKVLVLERLNRIGKKILVTGNGRCNMTNTKIQTSRYHSSSKVDLAPPLEIFGYDQTEAFFKELGIEPLIEGHKVYPLSEQANSILDVLRLELDKLGVEVITETKVTKMQFSKNRWQVMSEIGEKYSSTKLIVATGGLANSSFGNDETGYSLLRGVGHKVTPTFPTLVHIMSSSPYCKMMKGTKIKALATIEVDGRGKRSEEGEVLFTEDGLSGPPIFQLSRIASEAKVKKQKAKVSLDLFPTLSFDELLAKLYERIAFQPTRTVEELFIGLLHKRVVMPVLKCAQITSVHRACEMLEYEELQALCHVLKCFTFETEGTRGFKFAQVTAGGISVDEIDLQTMASKKAEHLYIIGEALDVDGDCGGFNLQWAWSTGYVAGTSVSQ